MTHEVMGVYCDNELNCNWSDETVKSSDYPKWVGKHCPQCGYSNLITQKDVDDTARSEKIVKNVNILWNVFKFFNPFFYKNLITGKYWKQEELKYTADMENGILKNFKKKK